MKAISLSTFFLFISVVTFAQSTNDTLSLPFEEDFQTGVFNTNKWSVEGENWSIAGQVGSPAPSAQFHYSPIATNYEYSLTSAVINGTGFFGGNVYFDFDLKLMDNLGNGLEKLNVEIFNGTEWTTVYADSSRGNFDWSHFHLDITAKAKYHFFKIRFRAWGLNTMNINSWLIDNINIYRYCPVPVNTNTEIPYPATHGCWILVDWEAPYTSNGQEGWLAWDSGENVDVVGLSGGGTFFVGSRFTPAQLVEYHNTYLKKIRLYPYAPGGTIVLKVWTGSNANQLVASQEVESYIPGQWNEFTLNDSVYVTGTSELWIGYEVTHPDDIYVAGVDAGPAVAGYGDMISLNGSVWESMAQTYDMDYNWNLQGYVEPIEVTPDTTYLTGYNIYREGEWIGTTTELSYIDKIRSRCNTCCYTVTAIYQDCESDFSNEACEWQLVGCFVDVSEIELQQIQINPVPAKTEVYISIAKGITALKIFNLLGNLIEEYKIHPDQSNLTVALDNYKAGVYFAKFETMDGRSFSRKFVVSH